MTGFAQNSLSEDFSVNWGPQGPENVSHGCRFLERVTQFEAGRYQRIYLQDINKETS